MKKCGFISGTRIQWDVATKAQVVEKILSRPYVDLAQYNVVVEVYAKEFNVNPVTIKAWVKKFKYSYKALAKCAPGVRSISDTVINKSKDLTYMEDYLKKVRDAIETKAATVEQSPNSTVSTEKVKQNQQMTIEFLNELTGN